MNIKQGLLYLMRRNRGCLFMNSSDCSAPFTFLLAKCITSCDNVFLKEYFSLTTYGVFRSINHCNHHIKKFYLQICWKLVFFTLFGSIVFEQKIKIVIQNVQEQKMDFLVGKCFRESIMLKLTRTKFLNWNIA
jgi:hypothetical protein